MSRMDFQNGRDVKQAAAAKLRGMGHKLISRCKFQDVLSLVELEMGRPGGDNPLRLMLDFLEDKTPDRASGSVFNLMQRPALKFSRQMQIAAERAKYQPPIPSITSNVPETIGLASRSYGT